MNLTKIISIVLFVISCALAFYLYNSIHTTILEKERIASTEKQITDKLMIIREAEKVYLEQNGKYTASWDTLISFIENGRVPITVRTETIIPLRYGVDSVKVDIDTIGFVSAKDKIFRKTYTINCAADGIFLGFGAQENEQVVKGAISYKLKRDGSERTVEYKFIDNGTVSSTAKINSGSQIKKGAFLITFWNYQFNPEIDVRTLSKVPGSGGKDFEIFTGKLDRNGVMVNVIHVIDPAPINPNRSAKNDPENRNRLPLQFGSRSDVSTVGNWE
jgi:hypothetical protein